MIEVGIKQTLQVINRTDFGVYLGEGKSEEGKSEKVLLPIKQVPEGIQAGDELSVFIYRDSKDRMIATTKEPLLVLGETAMMTVKEVTPIGAFLDWGLEKDLLLPYKEQKHPVAPGEQYPICLYTDKSGRLCGTMKVYDCLRTDAPYQKDDEVNGLVYELHDKIGAFVAVDRKYHAVVSRKELFEELLVGQMVTARVIDVRSDGKLNLSLRKKSYQQMDEDADKIMKVLEQYHGVLPFTDKSVDAQRIKEEFHLSKNAFKRAVGRLLKNKKIKITDTAIEIVPDKKENREERKN